MELGYDELKTDILQQEEAIRSETSDGVRQELWGVAIAYNLVRREMDLVARELDLPLRRISFILSLRLIQDLFSWMAIAKPGRIPEMVHQMRTRMKRLVLPPRKEERRYPRHVKIKMSGYARNHGHPC